MDKKGLPINKATVFSKCEQIGLDDNNRQTVINWIDKNLEEASP